MLEPDSEPLEENLRRDAENLQALENLRRKTERFLKEIFEAYEVRQDSYVVRSGTTALFIEPEVWNEDDSSTILSLKAIVLRDVRRAGNEDMFERLSELNEMFRFGKFYWSSLNDNENGGAIFIEQQLLGEYMDFEEFEAIVISLLQAADEFDEELQAEFGGKRWVD